MREQPTAQMKYSHVWKNRVRWECEKTLCWQQVGSRASC